MMAEKACHDHFIEDEKTARAQAEAMGYCWLTDDEFEEHLQDLQISLFRGGK